MFPQFRISIPLLVVRGDEVGNFELKKIWITHICQYAEDTAGLPKSFFFFLIYFAALNTVDFSSTMHVPSSELKSKQLKHKTCFDCFRFLFYITCILV